MLLPSITSRMFDHNSVIKPAHIPPMDENAFRQFIAQRPALHLSALAEERHRSSQFELNHQRSAQNPQSQT